MPGVRSVGWPAGCPPGARLAEPPTPATTGALAADRAAGNAALRAAAEIVARVASLALVFVLAREVGVSGLGVYVFAIAWAELANLPVDMGFDRHLTRRVAHDRANVDRLLFNVMTVKALRAGPVLGLTVIMVSLLGYPAVQREAVYAAAVAVVFDSLSQSVMAVFVGLERGGLAALVLVVQRVLAAVLGLVVLAAGCGVVAVLVAYAASTALALALALVLLRSRVGWPRIDVSRAGRRDVSKRSAGLAVQEIFSAGVARADVILLSLLATSAAVGVYGAGYRLLEVTLFLPLAIATAFAAMFTYLDRSSEPAIQTVYGYALKITTALMVPCAVTLFVLAEPTLRLLFGGDFDDSVTPLRLLAPVVALLGIVIISNSLVISRRDTKIVAWAFAGAFAVNLIANLLLIGPYGASGAAGAMLITEALFAIVMLELAARTVGRPPFVRTFGGTAVAAAGMAACMVALADVPLLALGAGAAVYLAALVGTERLINPRDLALAGAMVRRRLPGRLKEA